MASAGNADCQMDYKATLWRKSLERRGWKRLDKYRLPNELIEFHIIHQGKLYSGRCMGAHPIGDTTQPGTIAYVVTRRDLMVEGVWRRARNPDLKLGQVCRPWQ